MSKTKTIKKHLLAKTALKQSINKMDLDSQMTELAKSAATYEISTITIINNAKKVIDNCRSIHLQNGGNEYDLDDLFMKIMPNTVALSKIRII